MFRRVRVLLLRLSFLLRPWLRSWVRLGCWLLFRSRTCLGCGTRLWSRPFLRSRRRLRCGAWCLRGRSWMYLRGGARCLWWGRSWTYRRRRSRVDLRRRPFWRSSRTRLHCLDRLIWPYRLRRWPFCLDRLVWPYRLRHWPFRLDRLVWPYLLRHWPLCLSRLISRSRQLALYDRNRSLQFHGKRPAQDDRLRLAAVYRSELSPIHAGRNLVLLLHS